MQTIAYYRIAKEDMDSTGYEIGLMGMEGRGLYAGANVGKDGVSLYASWAENGGWNYGGGYWFEAWRYIGSSNGHYLSILGGLYEDFNLTLPADGYYADDVHLINIAQKYLDENPDVFTFIAHGASDGIGLNKNVTRGVISPEEFVKRLKNHEFGYYNNEKIIQLISCNTGYGDDSFAEQVAQLMPAVTVIAPNAYVILNSRKWWHVIGDAQLLLRSNLDGNATGDEKWREFKK